MKLDKLKPNEKCNTTEGRLLCCFFWCNSSPESLLVSAGMVNLDLRKSQEGARKALCIEHPPQMPSTLGWLGITIPACASAPSLMSHRPHVVLSLSLITLLSSLPSVEYDIELKHHLLFPAADKIERLIHLLKYYLPTVHPSVKNPPAAGKNQLNLKIKQRNFKSKRKTNLDKWTMILCCFFSVLHNVFNGIDWSDFL